MIIPFYKYQGTGNDFILFDNRDGKIHLTTAQIKHLCDRRFGIGADGLMLLESLKDYDFKMVYYNSDGNESTMCGNGGRCICAFANRLGIVGDTAHFMAIDGKHSAHIHKHFVSLKMNNVEGVEKIGDDFYLNTGSPHYVKVVTDIKHINVFEEGRKVRYNERFTKEGTNVNFIERVGENLHVRTYERGVEDETLSCGTGVTASALVAAKLNYFPEHPHCHIVTPGGELKVKYHKKDEAHFNEIWLEGAAEYVFEGVVDC